MDLQNFPFPCHVGDAGLEEVGHDALHLQDLHRRLLPRDVELDLAENSLLLPEETYLGSHQ